VGHQGISPVFDRLWALALLFRTVIPIVRRAHHLNLHAMAEDGGHGARETVLRGMAVPPPLPTLQRCVR